MYQNMANTANPMNYGLWWVLMFGHSKDLEYLLGPIMFLISIADSVSWRLFANDCLLYRVIGSEEDTFQLQYSLDHLSQWAQSCMADEI